ncbi:protein phosphatase CheZ [Roseateles sp. DAIF2]|uniref:protein phosphatase CheZ n=1 Tax=Roseateles sp. DAIF2 TaxID=2714952 RepID=UPI0018A305C7|nr:protein phosphatase CheZ [Roseateles sp. DAIF2]QPF72462.1 protein phosphatase CheZ [Roseateles sp. DAIF2]
MSSTAAVTHPPALQQFAHELPDACERLAYVKQMTAQAANKVLGLVEGAQDDAEQVRRQGTDLSESLARMATSPELSLERARSMMKLCAAYAATAASFAAREKGLHSEIMMAQDFQDLSGQVINKVIRMLEQAEGPLNELVGETPVAPPPAAPEQLQGVQTPDKALKQDDVDDLLASLGF